MASISKQSAKTSELLRIANERTGEILKVVSPHDFVIGISGSMHADLRVIGSTYITSSLYVKQGASGTLVLPNGEYALRGGASIQVVDDGDGGFTINSLAPGSIASAPKNAPFLTYAPSGDLSNEKVLAAAGPITFDPGTATIGFDANADMTVNSLTLNELSIGGEQLTDVHFILSSPSAAFPNGSVISGGSGIGTTNSSGVLEIYADSTIPRISGASFTGAVSSPSLSTQLLSSTKVISQNLTGSLTKLTNGSDYLRAGVNVTLATGSDGSVTISAPAASGAPLDARYLIVGQPSQNLLTDERYLSIGSGLNYLDGGSGNSFSLSVSDSHVAFLTGANFTGPVTASNLLVGGAVKSQAFTGSLTKLFDGSPYLRAGENVEIFTGSDGSVTISSKTGSFMSGPFLLHEQNPQFPGSLAILEGDGIEFEEDENCGNLIISAKLGAGAGITLTTLPTREIVISSDVGNVLLSGSFIVASSSGEIPSARILTSSLGIRITDTGPGGSFDIVADPLQIAYLTGADFSGHVKSLGGFTGSLTRLADGSDYLRAGSGISIFTGSDGSITISGNGSGGEGTITEVLAGAGLAGGGSSGSISLSVDPLQIPFLTGANFTGEVQFGSRVDFYSNALFYSGLSGSLTTLQDGSSYLRAGAGINIQTGSGGWITISSTVTSSNSTNVSVSGKERETLWINSGIAAGTEITFSTIDFSKVLWKKDLIDVYVNGQLQHSSSDVEVSSGIGDYYILNTGSIIFGFDLEPDDSVDITIQGGDTVPASTLSEPFVVFAPPSNLTNSRVVTAGAGIEISTGSAGQVVISTNGLGGNSSAYVSRLSINEIPQGQIDGANSTFVLARSPSDASQVMLWLNGQLLTQGTGYDYQVVGNTITMNQGSVPYEDDLLSVMYPYSEASSRYVLNERVYMSNITAQSGIVAAGELAHAPQDASKVMFFWNGQLLSQGQQKDYTIVGKTIYLNFGIEEIEQDDIFIATYTAIADNVYYEVNEEITISYNQMIGLWTANLSHQPSSESKIMLFMNGQLLRSGQSYDFTSQGNEIVMLDDEINSEYRFYVTYEYTA